MADDIEAQESVTHRNDILSVESTQWIAAMGEEIESLDENHTWELVKPLKARGSLNANGSSRIREEF